MEYLESMRLEEEMDDAQTVAIIAARLYMHRVSHGAVKARNEMVAECLDEADMFLTGARFGWSEPYPWTPEGEAAREAVTDDKLPF